MGEEEEEEEEKASCVQIGRHKTEKREEKADERWRDMRKGMKRG